MQLKIEMIDWFGRKHCKAIPVKDARKGYTLANRIYRLIVSDNVAFEIAVIWCDAFNEQRWEDSRVLRGLMGCKERIGAERGAYWRWREENLKYDASVAPLTVALPPSAPARWPVTFDAYLFAEELKNA